MMFHAQIAARAFNAPLLVEPSKAMAFLAGLGPRITGQQVRLAGLEVALCLSQTGAEPAGDRCGGSIAAKNAPIFLLVQRVKLRKPLDLARDALRAVDGVSGLILANWGEG